MGYMHSEGHSRHKHKGCLDYMCDHPENKKTNPWLFKTLKCAMLEDTGRRAREVLERDIRVVPLW